MPSKRKTSGRSTGTASRDRHRATRAAETRPRVSEVVITPQNSTGGTVVIFPMSFSELREEYDAPKGEPGWRFDYEPWTTATVNGESIAGLGYYATCTSQLFGPVNHSDAMLAAWIEWAMRDGKIKATPVLDAHGHLVPGYDGPEVAWLE